MEKNPEINNGSYTTEYRQLDTRIGRWLSIDPKADIQPAQSPYNFSNDMPIIGNDPDGDVCIPCVIVMMGGLLTAATPTHSPSGNSKADAAAISKAQHNQNLTFAAAIASYPIVAATMSLFSTVYTVTLPTVVVTASRIKKTVETAEKVLPKTTKVVTAMASAFGAQTVGSGVNNIGRMALGQEMEFRGDIDAADIGAAGLFRLAPIPMHYRAGAEALTGLLIDFNLDFSFDYLGGDKGLKDASFEIVFGASGAAFKKFNFDGFDDMGEEVIDFKKFNLWEKYGGKFDDHTKSAQEGLNRAKKYDSASEFLIKTEESFIEISDDTSSEK